MNVVPRSTVNTNDETENHHLDIHGFIGTLIYTSELILCFKTKLQQTGLIPADSFDRAECYGNNRLSATFLPAIYFI